MAGRFKPLTFEKAIENSQHYKKRHLLLGNGFSIACRHDIFMYQRLFEQADFSKLNPSARQVFADLETADFEHVIKTLRHAARLLNAYGIPESTRERLETDAECLKDLLVETIAASHPERPSDISNDEYAYCKTFLSNFDSQYTLNYDLLLYWTKMHEGMGFDDGFRTSIDDIEQGEESDYVIWDADQSRRQDLWFLHGALHLFDSGIEIQKYTWKRTGVRLIQQTRNALSRNLFPIFVSEGESSEKLERIRHNDYLAKARRSFQSITGCLFIYGHSLAANDEHFLKLIERGKLQHVFVGLYGDPKSAANKGIKARAERLSANRSNPNHPLSVDFYDAATASVWRP